MKTSIYSSVLAAALLPLLFSCNKAVEPVVVPEDGLVTITASRGRVIPGHIARAHGRATQCNQDTVNIEVIIEEVE